MDQEAQLEDLSSQGQDPAPAPSQEPTPSDPEEGQADPESPEGEGEPEGEPTNGEGTPADAKPGDPPTETPAEKHKRKGGYERKIEKLERQMAEKDALLAQALGRLPQPAGDKKEKTQAEQAKEYIGAMVQAQLAEEREVQRQANARAEFQKRRAEAQAKHPDFEEVLSSVDSIRVPEVVQQALLTSDKGPDIMYQLAKNPAELARISALPPILAAVEIGKLEARLASGAPTKAAIRRPTAPAPIAPVTERGPTTIKKPEDMSYEEYKVWRSQKKR